MRNDFDDNCDSRSKSERLLCMQLLRHFFPCLFCFFAQLIVCPSEEDTANRTNSRRKNRDDQKHFSTDLTFRACIIISPEINGRANLSLVNKRKEKTVEYKKQRPRSNALGKPFLKRLRTAKEGTENQIRYGCSSVSMGDIKPSINIT